MSKEFLWKIYDFFEIVMADKSMEMFTEKGPFKLVLFEA